LRQYANFEAIIEVAHMKLMSLNIWGGHLHAPLLDFIKEYNDIDIFCFQEVYHNAPHKISTEDRENHLGIFSELQNALPNHSAYFRPVVDGIYGIGLLIKNNIKILNEGEIIIHENLAYSGVGPKHTRNLQFLEFASNSQHYTVINIHGLWNGLGKTDSPERIEQSKRIKAFMNTLKTPTILCGDFNLNPDTESLKIVEKNMSNLIKINNITSTRSRFYPKDGKFADYVITSPDLIINHFSVLPHEVSDHLPLLLDFA
jgi:endonuclease/exonuclease/phosphatase family metal-dependent hydrolase